MKYVTEIIELASKTFAKEVPATQYEAIVLGVLCFSSWINTLPVNIITEGAALLFQNRSYL